jgi:hypothetical protein
MQTATLRALMPGGLLMALSLAACADADPAGSGGAGGAAGSGTSTPTSAGSPAQPSGGSVSANPTAGAAGAYVKPSGTGGNDDGGLFDPGLAVPFDPNAAGGTGGAPVSVGGSGGGVNTDGFSVTSHISGNVNGTAEFTQHGVDVTVVVKLTKCPDGTLGIHINDGDSCDNTGTEGKPWDGNRGNIGDMGTIMCSKNSASLTYTRKGTDPTMNWTVGDHTKADLTPYVVIVSSAADGKSMSSFIGCGNFFK